MALPSPLFRVTFRFSYGAYGFTETLWSSKANASLVFVAAGALASRRMGMSDYKCVLEDFKVHDMNLGKRNALLSEQLNTSGSLNAQPPLISPISYGEHPAAAIRCRFTFDIATFTHYWIKGFPVQEEDVDVFINDKAWKKAFDAWSNQLTTNAWSILQLYQNIPMNRRNIINVATIGPRGAAVTVATAAPGIAIGDLCTITGVNKQIQGLNGRKKCLNILTNPDGSITYVLGGVQPVGLLTAPTGTIASLVPSLQNIVDVQAEAISERKPGRPLGLVPGRRSNRLPLRG